MAMRDEELPSPIASRYADLPAHNALGDCVSQMVQLRELLMELRETGAV